MLLRQHYSPQGSRRFIREVIPILADPRYLRPAEVRTLLGDPAKAREKLGWMPEVTLEEMVREMVQADLAQARRRALLKHHGYEQPVEVE